MLERRSIIAPGSVSGNTLRGHAAVFGRWADVGSWRERIAAGAFNSLSDDVIALANHDLNYVLGSTRAGTLRLGTDQIGLWYEIDPPRSGFVEHLMESVRRGDTRGASIGFHTVDQHWDWSSSPPARTLLAVDLREISISPMPAYSGTSVVLA
jgi:HK97 family phage prohead protease